MFNIQALQVERYSDFLSQRCGIFLVAIWHVVCVFQNIHKIFLYSEVADLVVNTDGLMKRNVLQRCCMLAAIIPEKMI